MFQNPKTYDSNRDGLLFGSPHRSPIQRGEGVLSILSGLWNRVSPFLGRMVKKSGSLAKTIANSELAKDVTKSMTDSLINVSTNAAADLLSSNPDLSKNAEKKLNAARQEISEMIRMPNSKTLSNKMKERKSIKRNRRKNKENPWIDVEDDELEEDENGFVVVPKPPKRKQRKRKVTSTKRKRPAKDFSLFEDDS